MQMLHAVMTHPQLLVSRGRFLSPSMQGVRTQSVNSIRGRLARLNAAGKPPVRQERAEFEGDGKARSPRREPRELLFSRDHSRTDVIRS